jgi:hypothetical protein
MPDEKITNPATGNAPHEPPKSSETSPQTSKDVEGSDGLSQELDDIISSFSSPTQTGAGKGKEKELRRAPRFRVNWHADVISDDHVMYHGFINDISAIGASVFLESSLHTKKCTLHIHVPPLNLKSKSHLMKVSGKPVYVVYDGDKQLFRTAISFIRFNPESELAHLKERLTKHQSEIPGYY